MMSSQKPEFMALLYDALMILSVSFIQGYLCIQWITLRSRVLYAMESSTLMSQCHLGF